MKINFNELKEIDVPNMNGGNGAVKSKMFMNNRQKFFPLSIRQHIFAKLMVAV